MASPTSTAPADDGLRLARRGSWLRRLFRMVLAAHLLAAALMAYGPSTKETTAAGGDYELTVRYSARTRPGLATPWSVEVRKDGGFDGEPVTLATTAKYFDLFDENGLDPDPSAATTDGENVIWEFESPEKGDVMLISFDARIEPAAQLAWIDATTSVLDEGEPVASARYRTFVFP